VRETAADVLGLAARKVDPRRGFFDLGMDSLLAVELRHRLEASTGVALPATLTFKYPTVAAVAEFLRVELLGAVAAPPTAAAAAAGSLVPDDDIDLSEDELAVLLASKLGQVQ
jgi:myxalamid-type polyketide synthase MxaE and MxaD